MLNKILLPFSLVSNLATLLGLWIAYASASASIQEKVGHLLILCGGIASIIAYVLFAVFLMRPRSEPQYKLPEGPKPEGPVNLDPPKPENTWGEIMEEEDARKIQERVWQISQRKEFHFDNQSDPYLDIITELGNASVFDLVSFGEISGHGLYASSQLAIAPRVLGEPVMVRIKHGERATLTVRQSLSSVVADTMVANLNRGILADFEGVSVSFKMLSPTGSPQTYRWWGPRFPMDEAKRV